VPIWRPLGPNSPSAKAGPDSARVAGLCKRLVKGLVSGGGFHGRVKAYERQTMRNRTGREVRPRRLGKGGDIRWPDREEWPHTAKRWGIAGEKGAVGGLHQVREAPAEGRARGGPDQLAKTAQAKLARTGRASRQQRGRQFLDRIPWPQETHVTRASIDRRYEPVSSLS